MDIWIFGNEDVSPDALPVTLIPDLREIFPQHTFTHKDPLDDGEIPDPLVIIDTVEGIERVATFSSLKQFQESPRVTLHDFDVYTQLSLIQKIQKLPKLTIIGVPPNYQKEKALEEIRTILS